MANDDVTESAATENEKMETRMIEGRDYFFLFPDGDVGCVSFRNASFEKKLLEWGNFFLTRAEAEAARERVRAALKGESGGATAESAATQLALQAAEQAEARTREERDKLREERDKLRGEVARLTCSKAALAARNLELQDATQAMARTREERDKLRREVAELSRENAELAASNVELREQIRELEHDRHCALLQSKANSQDAAHWKQTAEAMTKMFMDVEGELRELKAKAACEEA